MDEVLPYLDDESLQIWVEKVDPLTLALTFFFFLEIF